MTTIKQLKEQLEKEKLKLEREKLKFGEKEELKRLSKELDILRNPKKYKVREGIKRTGRGFVILSKKVGKGIGTYAQRLAEANESSGGSNYVWEESKPITKTRKVTVKRKPVKRTIKRRKVRRSLVKRRKVVRRKPVRRVTRRKTVKRSPVRTNYKKEDNYGDMINFSL